MQERNVVSKRLFNLPVTDKRIKELKDEFLVFLREFIDILYTVKGGGVEFIIRIANEPVQGNFQHFSHFGRRIDRRLRLITFITADGRAFSAQVARQIFLADALIFARL